MEQIELYDTVRDGFQSPDLQGKPYAYQKLRIAEGLGMLGTSDAPIYEELGWPSSNPEDAQVYEQLHLYNLGNVIPAVFGSTRKVGTTATEDDSTQTLIRTKQFGVNIATIFGKSDPKHVKHALKTTLDDNLEIIADTVKELKRAGMKVFYDAEHFFDGFKRDPDYALSTLRVAAESGAERLVLCDTNGACLPFEIREIVQQVKNYLRENGINTAIGIHAHDDGGLGVANSLEGILAGASQVHGCVIPIGERTGNANLTSIAGLMHYRLREGAGAMQIAEHGFKVPNLNYTALKALSDFVYTVAEIKPNPREPFVGDYAALHTGGVHQDAENKSKGLYSTFNLKEIGNDPKRVVLGLQSGTSHIVIAVEQILGLKIDKKDPRINAIYREVTDMTAKGYHIGFLQAEQELLICQHFGWQPPFEVKHLNTYSNEADGHTISTAFLELNVAGNTITREKSVQDNGTVDAMYVAMQEGLTSLMPAARDIEVVGFNVSLAKDEGAASPVRVYFELGTPERRWGCVGVARNMQTAAKEALVKGINYYFLRQTDMVQSH